MKTPVVLKITIESIRQDKIGCHISGENGELQLLYYPESESIHIATKNQLAETVQKFQFQLVKVLKSAMKGDFTVGQIINCVFIEDFKFLNEKDYANYIRLNRSNGSTEITTHESALENAYKVYADGSFSDKTNQSAYGGIIEDTEGNQEIYQQSFSAGSSNLMELLAVTEGLQRLKHANRIQINTDSRFVIRGLTQWVHFWRHNNWQTAYGVDVKFAKHWQHIDQLCDGKIIEFKWIKGHSGHEEQSFCHDLARESTSKI